LIDRLVFNCMSTHKGQFAPIYMEGNRLGGKVSPMTNNAHYLDGTSTQKGQFAPTVGEGNWLRWLRMANEIQCIIPYVTR